MEIEGGVARHPDGPVLAFFDVDGTLVHRTEDSGPGTHARPAVVEAVRAFAERGGIPILSTGRSMCGVEEVRSQIDFAGFVTMDGAYVRVGERIVLDVCFPPAMLERIVSEMVACKMSAFFQGTEVCAQVSPDGRDPFGGQGVRSARTLEELEQIKPDLRFGKIDFFGIDYDRYRKSEYLGRELVYYDVANGCHELVMPGVSKGAGALRAIEEVTRACGMPPSRVLAFGDSENDLSLFEVADEAVAMGQASDRVKSKATHVTASCGEDGIAVALHHFGLA